MTRRPPRSTRTYSLLPSTTLFRSALHRRRIHRACVDALVHPHAARVETDHRVRHADLVDLRTRTLRDDVGECDADRLDDFAGRMERTDRKITRLNSSH